MAELRAHAFKLSQVTLHGVSAGDGPLVILLHGVSSNAYVFEPMMGELAKAHRVLSLDMRGHGRSSKPASGYSADDYAADVTEVIRSCGQKAIIVGHALGARAAFHAAAMAPGQVSAVVGIEFVPFIEADVFEHLESRVLQGHRTFESETELKEALSRRYVRMPPAAIARRAAQGFTQTADGLQPLSSKDALRQSCEDIKQPFDASFSRISQRALLIRGQESAFVSPGAWQKAKALRPDFDYRELANSDHYICEEIPEVIAAEIASFARTL
jgi:2-(acetamidomethylene)succinate hydrolase